VKLSPPKAITWWICFVCAVIGILCALNIVVIPMLAGHLYWIVVGGLVLLLIATVIPGL
jgi:hypothetical protein